jgi:hypothetical protein
VFADTSDVTLTTGNPRAELDYHSARTGPPAAIKNYLIISLPYVSRGQTAERDRTPFFCPAARFAVLDTLQNGDRLIASREYGLY